MIERLRFASGLLPGRLFSRVNFRRVFVLSPAHCGGERAQLLLRDRANFPLARQLRSRRGLTLGETFTFLSGLYFRGKMEYVNAFARPSEHSPSGALVITTNCGLIDPQRRVRINDLRAMGCGDIDPNDPAYRLPMEHDAEKLADWLGKRGRAILLGSIASGKYCDILLKFLGPRLLFPQEFIGRGDMSRGGLMLRCVDAGKELTYIPVDGAVRRGKRPPRLERRMKRDLSSPHGEDPIKAQSQARTAR